jgi:hypothetical protein
VSDPAARTPTPLGLDGDGDADIDADTEYDGAAFVDSDTLTAGPAAASAAIGNDDTEPSLAALRKASADAKRGGSPPATDAKRGA